MDFSNTFKAGTRGFKKKPLKKPAPVLEENKEAPPDTSDTLNKDLEELNLADQHTIPIEIPRNLTITQEQMKERKCMDLRRWYCLARPQHPKSCGISSLTSCWNYLYSTLGVGQHRPISTEEALEVLGFTPPYTFDFGSFTGNDTLLLWFTLLNKHFSVKGQGKILYKPKGKTSTPETLSADLAHSSLLDGLRGETKAYIYHCWNHYFCPLGFDLTPKNAYEAYTEVVTETETWIVIGEVSKCYPAFHTKRWSEIVTDLNTGYPEFYNIRKSELGIQKKESEVFQEGGKKHGGNLHCIIEFEKLINDQ